MNPLMLINWKAVNSGFCYAMWVVVFVLATVVVLHFTGPTSGVHHVQFGR